jgi:phosphopantothenoylcysteine decarboxylase/phosphopantothenate--cysteine ligase
LQRILLGVTGGIAAYKSVELSRRLIDQGFEVRIVMTPSAMEFVTPLTFQAVTGQPVHSELFDLAAEAAMGHIELAKWADLILIAPASADFLARLRTGMANDLLTTLCLASEAKIVVAPAMNQQMWSAKATQSNVTELAARAVEFIGPAAGEQACGDVGYGRMTEVPEIVDIIVRQARDKSSVILTGQKWLITAGPTREAIDPVRYMTNKSSGKMGYALAQTVAGFGADVVLVSGPVDLSPPANVKCISVESADEMYQAVKDNVDGSRCFIGCAAVADYRPVEVHKQKIKKHKETLAIELVKNPDILAYVAALEKPPITVGFAAETENIADYAKAKLARKKLDMICANNVADNTIGFNSDDNAISMFFADGDMVELPKTSKQNLANSIVQIIAKKFLAS